MSTQNPEHSYVLTAREGKNGFWLYIATLVIIVLANIIGSLPFTFIALSKADGAINPDDMTNFDLLGISPALGLILVIIPFATIILGLWFGLKFIHDRPFVSLFSAARKANWSKIGFAALVWLIMMVVIEVIGYLIEPENYQFQFDAARFFPVLLVTLLFLPLQTSAEEFVFRGYLLQGIGLGTRRYWVAILITSVLFGGMHLANPEISEFGYAFVINYIEIGLLLAIVTAMDEGLEIALGVHAANNIYSATVVTFPSSALPLPALFSLKEYDASGAPVYMLIFGTIFILLMSKKYGWKNWKKLISPIQTKDEPFLELEDL